MEIIENMVETETVLLMVSYLVIFKPPHKDNRADCFAAKNGLTEVVLAIFAWSKHLNNTHSVFTIKIFLITCGLIMRIFLDVYSFVNTSIFLNIFASCEINFMLRASTVSHC